VTTQKPDERHAVSDERDGAGSAGDDTETTEATVGGGRTAVAARQQPRGKRSRREATGDDVESTAVELGTEKNGTSKKKAAKKGESRQNPITYVLTYIKQVIADLRKVIWPNRKQMVTYTSVVLIFLAFMVALIGGVDFGLAKLVTLVFG
jgi:preprotein translocase subunit SecE